MSFVVNSSVCDVMADCRECIRPHKSTTQRKTSRDLPDLLFKLTYHSLPSFAMKDKMREFSHITHQLIDPADLLTSSSSSSADGLKRTCTSRDSATYSSNNDLSSCVDSVGDTSDLEGDTHTAMASPKPPPPPISDRESH